jgi:hypothetical protein
VFVGNADPEVEFCQYPCRHCDRNMGKRVKPSGTRLETVQK